MLDSSNELVEATGWVDFMKMDKDVYEHLCGEGMSSLKVDWSTMYQNQPVHIQFEFFSRLFEANLVEFESHIKYSHCGV